VRFSDIPRGSRQKRGVSAFRAGILALVVLVLFTYFGFSKSNPFANPYELHAIFDKANRVADRSPVRIAGVTVGKVVNVEPLEDGSGKSRVTMELEESALPIKKDAELTIRSRLFLEGNYFIDLRPGRPGSPEVESGATIPPNQTSSPVQYSQVLTALQSETRDDLRRLLKEYSSALRGEGAAGFNQAIRHWEDAWRNTSQVNDATLGTEEHDLTRVLRGQARVFGALSSDDQALRSLITDLADTLGGFARQEGNLRAAIPELRDVLRVGRPALVSVDRALPEVRGFARDALPGVRSSRATLDAQIPFIRQARRLVSRRELGALVPRLRAAVPPLNRLNRGAVRQLEQNRALAACQNEVLLPFVKTPIPDPDFDWHTDQPWYKESPRALVGLSGESRMHDANSPFFRTLGGGGLNTVALTGENFEGTLYGQTLVPLEGVRPIRPDQRPAFRPDVPCETQEAPDLNAAGSEPGETQFQRRGRSPKEEREYQKALRKVQYLARREARGQPSYDPIDYTGLGERMLLEELGLRWDGERLVKVRKKR
jgi:phospholipid/cholesterol/gamma-HCH transport system substrate-binding protein